MNNLQPIQSESNSIMNRAIDVQDRSVTPVYVWKTGNAIYMTKKEKIVADAYIRSRNFAECARALYKEGFKKDWKTCKRWLERPLVRQYLAEQFEERGIYAGWTKERWVLVMTKHIRGDERLRDGDLYAMKLLASVMGWDMPEGLNLNQSINILQSDGRA